jgi:hypothetical protein
MESKPTVSVPSRITSEILGISQRMVQFQGARWEKNAIATHDSKLPNSPDNGLRREFNSRRRAFNDTRDINEYRENAVRERLGEPLLNWRKEHCHES